MSATQHFGSYETAFVTFIKQSKFPCVGAKAALGRGQIETVVAKDIRSNWDDLRVAGRLLDFAERYKRHPRVFTSFVLIYETPEVMTEDEFEHHLWKRIQSFSDKDSLFGAPVDPRVTSDPEDNHFSLSFGGEAFFVVGLHPGASRPARRFARPTLVFNAHSQFELLRAENRYESLRHTILDRDRAVAGSINPMLSRYGESSEAKQYSGRAVERDWACPFRRRDFSWHELDRHG